MLEADAPVTEREGGHKGELRLWLRLLGLANLVEGEIRRRLRRDFDATLPRFDLMAQLARTETGMSLGEASRRLMVSNGNLTGLVERLVTSGHVARVVAPNDRRSQVIRLTPLGRETFARMARAHEGWIAELLAGLSASEIDHLTHLVGRAKSGAVAAVSGARHQ